MMLWDEDVSDWMMLWDEDVSENKSEASDKIYIYHGKFNEAEVNKLFGESTNEGEQFLGF